MNVRIIESMEIICRRLYHLKSGNTEMTQCNVGKTHVESVFVSDIATLKIKIPRSIVEDFIEGQDTTYITPKEEDKEDGTKEETNKENTGKPPRKRS